MQFKVRLNYQLIFTVSEYDMLQILVFLLLFISLAEVKWVLLSWVEN